ncbi:unnamed protein product [Jaminaea pallidilutea]
MAAASSTTPSNPQHDLPLPSAADMSVVQHLSGHPLPAFLPLTVTPPAAPQQGKNEATGPIETSDHAASTDMFMTSLSHPVLVFVYPHARAAYAHSTSDVAARAKVGDEEHDSTRHLCAVRDGLEALQQRARGGTAAGENEGEGELKVFGLSGESPSQQSQVSKALGLNFPLLSDPTVTDPSSASSTAFHSALELPTYSDPATGQRYLQRLTLLFREGQVNRLDWPVSSSEQTMLRRAAQMLEQ